MSWGKGVFLLSLEGAGCSFILGLLCFSHLSVTVTRGKGSPRGGFSPLAGEGVQGCSDPAWVPPPNAPATRLAPAHHGSKHCTGVTPAAWPLWFNEVNPISSFSSSSPLQGAAGERGAGWAGGAQGRPPREDPRRPWGKKGWEEYPCGGGFNEDLGMGVRRGGTRSRAWVRFFSNQRLVLQWGSLGGGHRGRRRHTMRTWSSGITSRAEHTQL